MSRRRQKGGSRGSTCDNGVDRMRRAVDEDVSSSEVFRERSPSSERRHAHRLEHAGHWIGGLRRSLEHFDVAVVVSNDEVGEGSARVDGEAKSTAADLFGAPLGRL